MRLSKEPKAVAKALGQLGISARDAQGNFREMPDLLQALSAKMKNMGSADKMKYLSNIFGSEAASGMLAVMEAAVDGSLQQLTRLNRESSGQLQALSKNTGISIDDLRAGMQNADKPKEVQKALKSYGIALTDDSGKMRDFNAILRDLNNSMKDMEPPEQLKELTKIFGKDGARAVQALMYGMSKGLYDEYANVAKSVTGVSKEMADKVLNTFWGQKELAKSAISDLMITVGDVLLPTVKSVVKTFAEWTASLGKLASEHSEATKLIVGTVGAIAMLNVGVTAMKYAWLGMKLPFQTVRVAMDWLNARLLLSRKRSLWAAAKTKVLTIATKSWNAVMKLGRGLLDVGKLALYYGLFLVYCWFRPAPSNENEYKTSAFFTALASMAITLSTIRTHAQWWLYLAPYLAVAVIYYGKYTEKILLFETVGSLGLLLHNYLFHAWVYNPKSAEGMLLDMLLGGKKSVIPQKLVDMWNSTATSPTTGRVIVEMMKQGAQASLGGVYILCIIVIVLWLCRPQNISTDRKINMHPYAMTRLLLNAAGCYLPLAFFVYTTL